MTRTAVKWSRRRALKYARLYGQIIQLECQLYGSPPAITDKAAWLATFDVVKNLREQAEALKAS